jgi:chromosome segregation ATPase
MSLMPTKDDEINSLNSINEYNNATIKHLKMIIDGCRVEFKSLRAENERLRGTIRKANQDYNELRREQEQLNVYIAELEATID